MFGDDYVLEHHSLAGIRSGQASKDRDVDEAEEAKQRTRSLAENWDAPVVITTSVQFLESLFSNRPSACRKLHRIARSVVLFDEVQTLPLELIIPTLAALSGLTESRYRTTVVFSTATQPAFTEMNHVLQKRGEPGWQPREVVPASLALFSRARRTYVNWPDPGVSTSWNQVVNEIASASPPQVVCIVNLKRHAICVAKALQQRVAEGLHHLFNQHVPTPSSAKFLEKVRQELTNGKPCRLIATQCIEAGVDVDFPVAYRALGPLDAVAKAAGRCNRRGKDGLRRVHVFIPSPGVRTSGCILTLPISGLPGLPCRCCESSEPTKWTSILPIYSSSSIAACMISGGPSS